MVQNRDAVPFWITHDKPLSMKRFLVTRRASLVPVCQHVGFAFTMQSRPQHGTSSHLPEGPTPRIGVVLAQAWASFPGHALSPIEKAVSPARRRAQVIYFFSKQHQFVQCEIHPGRPHVLTAIDPDGVGHTERHSCAESTSGALDRGTPTARARRLDRAVWPRRPQVSRDIMERAPSVGCGVNRDGIVSAGESRPLSGPPSCTPMTASSPNVCATVLPCCWASRSDGRWRRGTETLPCTWSTTVTQMTAPRSVLARQPD